MAVWLSPVDAKYEAVDAIMSLAPRGTAELRAGLRIAGAGILSGGVIENIIAKQNDRQELFFIFSRFATSIGELKQLKENLDLFMSSSSEGSLAPVTRAEGTEIVWEAPPPPTGKMMETIPSPAQEDDAGTGSGVGILFFVLAMMRGK